MRKPDFQAGDIVNNGYVDRKVERVFEMDSGWVVQYTDIDGGGIDRCSEVILVSRDALHKPTYKIIEHSNADALSTAVNEAILEGFKPIGGVSMSEHRHYMQAMLKE